MEIQNNQKNFLGKIEYLDRRIDELLQEKTDDFYFIEYLQRMKKRLTFQKCQVEQLEEELEHNYQIYLQKHSLPQNQNAFPVQKEVFIQNQNTFPVQKETFLQNPNILPIQNEGLAQNKPFIQQKPKDTIIKKKPEDIMIKKNTEDTITKKNTEFTIAMTAFGIIGVFFILTAFVMFGINFMNGVVRGISLYVIAAVFLIVSEGFVYRKSSKMGTIISAIGIGGLFLSTILNMVYLHNFNMITGFLILMVIAAGTIGISWKRDSWILRLLGIIVCYLSFLPILKVMLPKEFLGLTVMLCIINIVCCLLPIQKAALETGIVHMFANVVFSLGFLWRARYFRVKEIYCLFFLFLFFIVLNLIFFRLLYQIERNIKQNILERQSNSTSATIVFCICGGFYMIMLLAIILTLPGGVEGPVLYIGNRKDYSNIWMKYGSIIILAIIGLVFGWLERSFPQKWIQYYFWSTTAFLICGFSGLEQERILSVFFILLVSKLFTKRKELTISEAVITAVACLTLLLYDNQPIFFVLLAGLVCSFFFIHKWQCYYEILLTGTLAVLVLLKLPNLIKLPIIVGIFFIAILFFHHGKRWKGKHICIFNYFALSCQALCFLGLTNRIYTRAYITYIMMLVFGLATIILTFQEQYDMEFKQKHLILAIFLTYMGFVCRMRVPVISSIILMGVALFSVGMGFAVKEKTVRIYGLVLSMLVCGKVAVYDFIGASNIQKIILFFVIGLIALVIAGIYVILEKYQRK